jgi:hypothetical protein
LTKVVKALSDSRALELLAAHQHFGNGLADAAAGRQREQMRLALGLGNIFEIEIGNRRLLQHRPRNRDIVVAGERRHHALRRVRHRGEAAREFRQRLDLDLLDQAADNVIEQRHLFDVEGFRAVQEQSGDAFKRLRTLVRRAMLDDVFQFGEQRSGCAHCVNPARTVLDRRMYGFTGVLGRDSERRVSRRVPVALARSRKIAIFPSVKTPS